MRGSSGTAASSPPSRRQDRPRRLCRAPKSDVHPGEHGFAQPRPLQGGASARPVRGAEPSGPGRGRRGMVQKVQRWSQPCWISTKARTDEGAASAAKRRKSSPSPAATPCPAPPPSPAPASGKASRAPGALQTDGQLGPSAAVQFVAVGKDGIDRLHPGPALRREGDSAAGGDDPGAGVAAAQAAQGLAGLTLGLGGDSAGLLTTRKGRERARRWPAMTALSHALRRQPRVTTSASPAPPSPEPRPETGPEPGRLPCSSGGGCCAAADAAEGGAGRAAGAQEPGMKGQDKRATSARSAGPERGQARPLVIAQRCGGRGSGGCGVHSL